RRNGGRAESLRSNIASIDWEYSKCLDRSTDISPIATPRNMKMSRCLTSERESPHEKLFDFECAKGIPA
ncbi:MAG: hypothetical protein ABGW75_09785, partial [Pirellulales bacterium]